jgi:pimeloyl-ACP methyl ester carboxylesterase
MQKKLQFQNKSINYWIEGSGDPLMLVHGFAEDHRVWIYQQKFLQNNFQLILPDLPGSGQSELLDFTGMESMAEVLLAILNQESIDQCTMIGHSMGGYVTLAFAEKNEDRLNSFCMFHSSAYPDSEEKKQARLKSIEFIRKNGVEEFLKASTPNLFAKDPEGNPKQVMIQELVEQYRDMKSEALIAYYEAMMRRPDRTLVLKTFTKPILYLLGKEDTAVLYQQGLEQTRLARNIEVHTLYQSGHMGMWEETVISNQVLGAFLQNNVG